MKKNLFFVIVISFILGFSGLANAQPEPPKGFEGSWTGLMPIEAGRIKGDRDIKLEVAGSEVEMESGRVAIGSTFTIPERKDKSQATFGQEDGLPCMFFKFGDQSFRCLLLPDGNLKLKGFGSRGVDFGDTILRKNS